MAGALLGVVAKVFFFWVQRTDTMRLSRLETVNEYTARAMEALDKARKARLAMDIDTPWSQRVRELFSR